MIIGQVGTSETELLQLAAAGSEYVDGNFREVKEGAAVQGKDANGRREEVGLGQLVQLVEATELE